MSLEELIKQGSSAIRNSKELTGFFIEYYQAAFNEAPSCWGCSWNNTFNKLASTINYEPKNDRIMITSEKTFVIKKSVQGILSYVVGHRTFRVYAKDAKDSFVINYLKYGTDEEIEFRKSQFDKLPEGIQVLELNADIPAKKTRKKRNK